MLRCKRLPTGAISVLCACAFVGACSDGAAPSSTAQPHGGAGASPTNESSAGAPATGGSVSGATAANGGRATAGDAPTATGGTNDVEEASGGASGSPTDGVRSVFYLDVQGRVLTFDEDARAPRTLVRSAGQGPDGVVVDVASNHVFWTTMGVPADDDGSLRRADLDGTNVVTLVPAGGAYTPKQLKLDVAAQKLYWSDREGMRIQRASTDGSELETLVTVASGSTARKDAANWCVGLALDVAHGFVYWTQKGPDDGMVGSIRRAHLQLPAGATDATRGDIEVLFEGLPEPVDLDLDVSNGYMYWTDRGDDTINRSAIEIPSGQTAATRTDRQIIVKGVREAIGVTLDLERGHVYYTSGASARVGRANFDGSGALDLVTGTGALTGIAVVQLPSH